MVSSSSSSSSSSSTPTAHSVVGEVRGESTKRTPVPSISNRSILA